MRHSRSEGFTLIEVLLAVGILGMVSAVTFLSFSTVTSAWRRGTELGESLNHGDYVMTQLVLGLRSAHYPMTGKVDAEYGMWMEDSGDGADESDVISWTKTGAALVGKDCPFAGSPHRVVVEVAEDVRGEMNMSVKAWRLRGQPEDFDPETDVEPIYLSSRVTGFDVKTAWELKDDEIDWLEEWEDTNRLPTVVEITLYLKPIEEDGEPVEVKRIVGVPIGALSWRSR